MIFSFFNGSAFATKEEKFWHWFKQNDVRLFSFETEQDRLFDELSTQLEKVNSDLTFEFGPISADGKRDFVISAGGIKSAFPAVEVLYQKAPQLTHWNLIKFRPRRYPLNDLEYAGIKVRATEVRYLLVKDNEKLGIVIFIPGYQKDNAIAFKSVGYLMLDEALGEYDVETKIGGIEFLDSSSEYFPQALPLSELAAHFDEVQQISHP